jgi:hypothetical protein
MADTQIQTINYKYGDTYAKEITIKNKTTGAAVDITGNTFTLNIYSTQAGETATYTIAGTITDAANGVVRFPITTTESNNEGVFYYDIKMNDGSIKTIIQGQWNFVRDITTR